MRERPAEEQRELLDERANLGQLLLRRFRWIDSSLLATLEGRGWPELRHSHSLVMAQLPKEGIRAAELARRMGISRQSLHETLTELKELGLVESIADERDRRAQVVRLTALGRKNVAAARSAFANIQAELARRIGSRRINALRDALQADWGDPISRA